MTASIAMIVSNRYDPDPRVHKEATALVAAGHRVTVLAYDREHERPQAQRIDGVEVVRIRGRVAPLGALGATALGLAGFLRRARRHIRDARPDVVHCHDLDTCALGLWWQRATSPRARFVFDAHDLYWTRIEEAALGQAWRAAGSAALRQAESTLARAADLLITVTEGMGAAEGLAERYRRLGCAPIVILNAPIPPARIAPIPERFTVGYVGVVRDREMFGWLVDAIARLPPSERPDVRIAGGGLAQREVAGELARASERLGFRAIVSGIYDPAELPALIAETSVQYAVYPPHDNVARSLPNKMFDSVAHGRPVIGTADTLMAAWIRARGWGWTVAPADIEALARALTAARRDGERIARTMRPAPTWADQAERLVAAYDRMLHPGVVARLPRTATGSRPAPLVSVLMPAHNAARFLHAAVASVAAQDHPRFELVIGDDASTDDTPEIAAALAADDARIRVVTSRDNLGSTRMRNRLFDAASPDAELIAVMDADDVCEPQRLSRQVQFLAENPAIAVVGSDIAFIDENDQVLGRREYPRTAREIAFRRWIDNPFAHPATMIRARVLREVGGYDESRKRLDDYELWMRILDRYPGANIPEVLLRYRISTTQSKTRNVKAILEAGIALKRERMPPELRTDPRVTGRLLAETALLGLPSRAIVRLFYARYGF